MNQNQLQKELNFSAARSSGAGGQHVNKVSTKVLLKFDVAKSFGLDAEEKELLQQKLHHKINKNGILQLQCDETRSQLKNKEKAIRRFFQLVSSALRKPKLRKKTKPSKASLKKKAENKQRQSLKKSLRKKPGLY